MTPWLRGAVVGVYSLTVVAVGANAQQSGGTPPPAPAVVVDWQTMAVQVAKPLASGHFVTVDVTGLVPACFVYRIELKQARSASSDISTLAGAANELTLGATSGGTTATNPAPPAPAPAEPASDSGARLVQLRTATEELLAATRQFNVALAAVLGAGCRGRGGQLRAELTALLVPGGPGEHLHTLLSRGEYAAQIARAFVAQSSVDTLASRSATRAELGRLATAIGNANAVLVRSAALTQFGGAPGTDAAGNAAGGTARVTVRIADDADSVEVAITATPLEGPATQLVTQAVTLPTSAVSTDTPPKGTGALDAVWIATERKPPRASFTAGYMISAIEDRHYAEVQLPTPGSTTDTYRTFANTNSGSSASGLVLLANVRVLDPIQRFGADWTLALSLGSMVRTVNNEQKSELVGGVSVDIADLFFLTVAGHHGRREYLVIGSPDSVRQTAIPASITRDNAVGVQSVTRLAFALSIRIR